MNAGSYISCIIWEVDFLEDLRAVLLDSVHFYEMGRKIPGLLTEYTKQMKLHTQKYIYVEFQITKLQYRGYVFKKKKLNSVNSADKLFCGF